MHRTFMFEGSRYTAGPVAGRPGQVLKL